MADISSRASPTCVLFAGHTPKQPVLGGRVVDAACGCATSIAARPVITQGASGRSHYHPVDDVIPSKRRDQEPLLQMFTWLVYEEFPPERRQASDGQFV